MRASLAGCLIPHIARPHICIEGPTWTQNVMPPIRYAAIAYGNGIFMAGGLFSGGGSPAGLATSPDAITWTATPTRPSFASGYQIDPYCLAFGNGRWVTAGSAVDYAYSDDNGATWTVVTGGGAPNDSATKGFIYFANGVFVLLRASASSSVCVSPDGLAWSANALPVSSSWTTGVFGNGVHIAAEAVSGATARSLDNGASWSFGGNLPFNAARKIAFGNGRFVALNLDISTHVAVSTDNGVTWTDYNTLPHNDFWSDIIFNQGVFIASSLSTFRVLTSFDGIAWNESAHTMPVALGNSNALLLASNGQHRYAAVAGIMSTTAGAWGDC